MSLFEFVLSAWWSPSGLLGMPTAYVLGALVLAALVPPRAVGAGLTRLALRLTVGLFACAVACRLIFLIGMLTIDAPSEWDVGIQAVAAAWIHGQPLYASAADGTAYGLLYGPALYEILGLAEWVFGIGSPMTALPMVMAELAAMALTWWAIRRQGVPAAIALGATGVLVAELAIGYLSGPRADQWLVLLAAIMLVLAPALERGNRGAAFGLGVCGGLAMAFKITGFAYAVPFLFLIPPKTRFVPWALVLAGAGVGFLAPYIPVGGGLSDHLSFLARLRPVAVSIPVLIPNIAFTIMVLSPLSVWRSGIYAPRDRRLLSGLFLTMVPMVFVASITGAGRWHLVPFLPLTTLLIGRGVANSPGFDQRRLAFLAPLFVLVLLGCRSELIDLRNLVADQAAAAATRAAVTGFLANHPGEPVAIGMANGEEPGRSLLQRQHLALLRAGQPLILTHISWNDLWTDANTRNLITGVFDHCRIRTWLTGPGDPFAAPWFDDRVGRRFQELYRHDASTAEMQVWTCRSAE